MRKKPSILTGFFILSLITMFVYVFADTQSFENSDGNLDFNNPNAIARGLDSGEVSVERLLNEGNSEQINNVFTRVGEDTQSKILSFFTESSVMVNGDVSSFKNGNIETSISKLNLNDYKSFDGVITINQDGTITISPNTDTSFKIGDNEVSSNGNELMISGDDSGTRTINVEEGSDISIKNFNGEVNLLKGSVSITDGKYVLGENSAAKFFDAEITTEITKISLNFESDEISYVLLSRASKRALLSGRDFSVEFFENSPYDFVEIDGSNIKVINGELRFTFDNEFIYINSEFNKGVKNMILRNLQTNHKAGVGMNGKYVAYSDPNAERVGFSERWFFIIHGYDAQLELDAEQIKKDYEILMGKLPENPNENKDFQDFVAQMADPINLRLLLQITLAQSPNQIKSDIRKDIERSGVDYTKLEDGSFRIKNSELESQRLAYERFIISTGGSKDGSELFFTIRNGEASIEYYPVSSDRTNFEELVFPNDRLLREVLLPLWVTDKNNIEDMPAELLCGFNENAEC